MRVNARFEGAAEQQVDYLSKTMALSVSEVLRLSVENYYLQVRGEQPALRHFGKHIGRYHSGHADTSAHYKERVSQAIEDKYPRRKR